MRLFLAFGMIDLLNLYEIAIRMLRAWVAVQIVLARLEQLVAVNCPIFQHSLFLFLDLTRLLTSTVCNSILLWACFETHTLILV